MADLNLTPARDATSFASSSTFPSHGNTNSYVYDVFINDHGTGVKVGLASHIYHRLVAYGLRVFWDQDELQQGDNMTAQVEGAIRTASVHVAIFTPTYAESSWCLDELVLMLESGSTIIPVYYEVEPFDLQWTWSKLGVYSRSLGVLENKRTDDSLPLFDSSIIQKWRRALFDASTIQGFELKACNDDEGQLVDEVVQQVLKKVRTPHLNVAKYPTDLVEKVEDVEIIVSLQQHSGKPRIVGIVGSGGVGKTTLAKNLFNRERSHYDRCCFLLDVRSSSLHSLQRMFLKDLTQLNVQIDRVDEGIEKLKIHLSPSHRFLIVLDDVDDIDQLDALFSPVKDTIHPSSLILVTSRNKDVLRSSGIAESSIYKMQGLNLEHSRELFCMSAFGQSHPAIGFHEVVEIFLDTCQGLPLSLKVLGALLHGKDDLRYWNAQLLKTSKILPSDIQSTLKISYDALDKEEKQIFLDIACFFIGEDRNTAIRIWDGSDWDGWLRFSTLKNRYLVEVDSENCLRMHDHLRDFGREVAENSEYPLRLWRIISSLFDDVYDRSPVRGINTDVYDWLNRRGLADRLLAVTDMSKLQLLRGEGYLVESILRAGQSPALTWLRWHDCPFSSLPSCIPMNKLRVLQITGDSLETLWLHESQAPLQLRELTVDAPLLKVPNSIGKLKHLALRELNIGAPLLKIPKSIEMLKHLGKIVVHGNGYRHAVDLKILPDDFCDLRFLEHLELKECSKLKSLPNSFGKLTNLQHIDLSGCSKLQMLVGSFGNLTGLQHIELSRCFSLKMLPDSLGNLTGLHHIGLYRCSGLGMLPESLGNLTNLQRIYLSRCSNLKMLPDSLGNLSGLQLIDLSRCSNLHMFPDSLGNLIGLQHINLIGCSNLQLLPDSLGNLKGLQYFNLSQCFNLDILPNSFMNLINLRHIDLSKCSNLEMLPYSFGNLMNLQYINLSGCSNLQMLPNSLGNLKNLQHFDLSWCSSLQKLPNSYGNLINLQHVDLSGCSNLQILPNSFGKLTNLQHIDLSWCSNLPILPNSFGNLIQLKHLCLRKCYDLTISSETLGKICTLEWLEISGCYGIEVLPPQVGHQRFLREMHLFCPFLKELPSDIGELSNLKVLHLASSCLETLPTSFGYLRSLEELGIHFCHQLKCLPDSIRMLTQLRKFTITGMNNLKLLEIEECLRSKLLGKKFAGQIETSTPSKLKGVFPNLQHLDIMDCHHLVQVGALPTTLIKLGLTNCLKLRKIGGLCGLVKLQILHIERCIEVEDLPRMETLVSLEELRATECVKLKSIKGLTRLKKLRTLDVAGCFELEELEGVEHVSSLERLNVSGCPKFPL